MDMFSFSYDDNGEMTKITSIPTSMEWNIDYQDIDGVSITDPAGRITKLRVSTADAGDGTPVKRLDTAKLPIGNIGFTYAAGNLITGITDQKGMNPILISSGNMRVWLTPPPLTEV